MHSFLLENYLTELKASAKLGPILDLACGYGRNGLFLTSHNLPVIFADRNNEALNDVATRLSKSSKTWLVDFELPNQTPLKTNQFGGVIVFRYLHRPLFDALKASVIEGGLVVYETFTKDQRQFGRPNRDEFLLESGELAQIFSDWKVLHRFEGIVKNEQGNSQAIAQIVAQKR